MICRLARSIHLCFVYSDLDLDANPRSLENSVEFAAKSLDEADLSDDRISIQFVQVGFSRRLFDALKDVANDYSVSFLCSH